MTKTLTIVLHDTGSMNLIIGGDIPPEMAAQLCLEAFKAFQEKMVSERIERLRVEKNEDELSIEKNEDEPTPEA